MVSEWVQRLLSALRQSTLRQSTMRYGYEPQHEDHASDRNDPSVSASRRMITGIVNDQARESFIQAILASRTRVRALGLAAPFTSGPGSSVRARDTGKHAAHGYYEHAGDWNRGSGAPGQYERDANDHFTRVGTVVVSATSRRATSRSATSVRRVGIADIAARGRISHATGSPRAGSQHSFGNELFGRDASASRSTSAPDRRWRRRCVVHRRRTRLRG